MRLSEAYDSHSARLALLALLSASTLYCFYKSLRLKRDALLFPATNPNPSSRGKLFFVSRTGTSEILARRLLRLLATCGLSFDLVHPKDYEPEDLSKETLVLIVASTWEDGNPPPDAGFFSNWLAESADDFRVGSLLLSSCKFAVFGVGSRSYGATFNAVARGFSKRMRKLGGLQVLPVGEGDVDAGDLDEVFDVWSRKLISVLKGGPVENGGLDGSEVVEETDADTIDGSEEDYDDEDDDDAGGENGAAMSIIDLEDIAGKAPSRKTNTMPTSNGAMNGKKEMVTPIIRANLEKQVFDSLMLFSELANGPGTWNEVIVFRGVPSISLEWYQYYINDF